MKLRDPEHEVADIIAQVEAGERPRLGWPCRLCGEAGEPLGMPLKHMYPEGTVHPFTLDVEVLRDRLVQGAEENNAFAQVWNRYRPDTADQEMDDEADTCWEFWLWLREGGLLQPEDSEPAAVTTSESAA